MAGKFIMGFIMLALIAGLAAGCGNKGPLFLPDAKDTSSLQSGSPH